MPSYPKPGNQPLEILKSKARNLRKVILEMCVRSGGHIASSLSCVEILVCLYHDGVLHIDPKHPQRPERDRFILSKGHAETALYAVLADRGFFPADWLYNEYRQACCLLGGHPDCAIPGVEVSTGALGHGLGIAAGMALGAKLDGRDHDHFVLMGDAECTEGAVWEAALFAARHGLRHLIAIVDRNRIGSIDFTENFTSLEPFVDKWRAFGWRAMGCNGHDLADLRRTLERMRKEDVEQPAIIIADTIKGKGVRFMENDPAWHVRTLKSPEDIEAARAQLGECEGELN